MSYYRFMLCIMMFLQVSLGFAQELSKDDLIKEMQLDGIHSDDLALIQTYVDSFSIEQLSEIQSFLSDSLVIANEEWFDVTGYSNWGDYNFLRSDDIVILTNLARRDLFLDPARQLNNYKITNMSDEALAALVFSQTYVEEKWDHITPWDGENNQLFNWVQAELLHPPMFLKFVYGDYLYQERVRYWYATHYPQLLRAFINKLFSDGDDIQATITYIQPPIMNAPRLAGYSYPIGNQLYLQTAESLLWYADYSKIAQERYGYSISSELLDTQIQLSETSLKIQNMQPPDSWEYTHIEGLWQLLNADFADELRQELLHPETASFWNVMRFVHAGARQREGGGSPDYPENNQPSLFAIQYDKRSEDPVGRETEDISAFSLITTVYSDSILLDFTNWDDSNQSIIVEPINSQRSDGIHRRLSERNKAIQVVEQMGNENIYLNATHVVGTRGLGLELSSQYDSNDGDFLPYTFEEAYYLVSALMTEATQFDIESSYYTLCNSPLLQQGYSHYQIINPSDFHIEQFCS